MPLNKAEQGLLDYVKQHTNSTDLIDGILETKIHSVYQSGMEDSAEICQRQADNIVGNMSSEMIEARRAHLMDNKAILEAANKPL